MRLDTYLCARTGKSTIQYNGWTEFYTSQWAVQCQVTMKYDTDLTRKLWTQKRMAILTEHRYTWTYAAVPVKQCIKWEWFKWNFYLVISSKIFPHSWNTSVRKLDGLIECDSWSIHLQEVIIYYLQKCRIKNHMVAYKIDIGSYVVQTVLPCVRTYLTSLCISKDKSGKGGERKLSIRFPVFDTHS